MARSKKMTKASNSLVLNFRISPEERDELRRIAVREDRSVGSVIRLAVRQFLALERAGR